ncbi:MAG: HAMP domain-containing protein [Candidatus Omnitrophica bacterium]|nr:HAMP domain-containing protein [Candidatus Omnitrophota bacterium]
MQLKSHQKITLALGTVVAVILVGLYFYLDNTLKTYTYNRIRTDLIQELTLVKVYLEQISGSVDFDRIADDLGNRILDRVTIISSTGVVLGDSMFDGEKLRTLENHLTRPEIEDALKNGQGENRRFSSSMKEEMLYVAVPFGSMKPPSIVRISVPLAEITVISKHLQKLLWFALVLFFLSAVFVGHFASLMITRPIARISAIAQAIAAGDFSKKATLTQNDEIADLAKAINFMSEEIRGHIAEVTASRSRLEAVFLSMIEGVMVVDSDGKILLINETLRKILRVEHETVGRIPLEIIRNIEVQDIVDAILKRHENVQAREMSFLLPEEKILRVHAAPIIRDKKIDGVVLVFHDITDFRHLETVRRDFVANVSHELRTPVANIKGYSETLLEGAIDDKANAQDFLKIIYSESDRLAKLIDDLLELAKYESDRSALNLQPCHIRKVFEWVLGGVNIQAKQRDIAIISAIPLELSQVKADDSAVAQILFNLIENAIKYSNKGGRVTVSARERDDCVEVSVADTGLGIPSEDLPRIFERFYRVDKAHSREIGGTGLGLSIVKHIVQAHNGQVSVESELGKGSVFYFTLPKA